MAEKIVINAETRADVGKGASRRLRRLEDKVPGILYGGGQDPVAVTMEHRELSKIMELEAFYSQILNVSVDGQANQAVVRDLQRHPATEKVQHVDFLRIRADRPIQVRVPIHFLNEADCVGVRTGGGTISHNLNEIEISCLPGDLPEYIDVDMENVDLGDTVHLSDLALPEGVTIPALALGEDRDIPVASVQAPRGGAEEFAEEEAAEGFEAEAGEGAEGTEAPEGGSGDSEGEEEE